MPRWEVVGGADKGSRGGILVRKGQELSSEQIPERLANGSIVEELELVGDRLNYRLVRGVGPAEGWVSLSVKGKVLVARIEEEDSDAGDGSGGGPGDSSGPVEPDMDVQDTLEAEVKAKAAEGVFAAYLPRYAALGGPLPAPRLRVLCFHNEGSAESSFTWPGSPLADWARESKAVEVCAFDYPGRAALLQAERFTAADALARDLLAVFHEKMRDSVPYVVWGHSVGAWVAFEYLILCRKAGLRMPKAAFFVAFPAPHMPREQRRWRRSSRLNGEKFAEEVRSWDREHFGAAGSVVFQPPLWEERFQPLLRADFELFDRYKFRHDGAPRFSFPIHAWHFSGDEGRVRRDMVELWRDWTDAGFECRSLDGLGHVSCFYHLESRNRYFSKVKERMQNYMEE